MGEPLFGVDIAAIIADTVAPGLIDATITRQAEGARDQNDLTGGKPLTPTPLTGVKGFWEDVPRMPPPGVEFELDDRIAALIGDTIPAGGLPQRNDAITIEGLTLYVVQLIGRDPAAALYRYLCRDRRGPDGV